jgi:hypothetical protein
VLAWELIASHYPKYLLGDIVYLDVEAAMAKTAAAMYNDDPAHKATMQMELMLMRISMGMNFERGVKQLFTKVEEVEEMNVMVITGLPADQVENRKKELLYVYLQKNGNFKDVIKDYRDYRYSYASMFDQCVTCLHDLDVPRATSTGRGRDTARLDTADDGEVHEHKRAFRASKQERVQALELGWDPYELQTSLLTKRADGMQAKIGECFTFSLYGRCPFGDTGESAGCKFLHVDEQGKTVTRGVSTFVPPVLKCNRCSAVGKHWSFKCKNSKTNPLPANKVGESE